ncbi:hypothetical protein GF376_03660 [Candidatus Peregrinibacteria bacterium]|nr:hypothetical protein [Candidatus Peregrinibacteria bacterium]
MRGQSRKNRFCEVDLLELRSKEGIFNLEYFINLIIMDSLQFNEDAKLEDLDVVFQDNANLESMDKEFLMILSNVQDATENLREEGDNKSEKQNQPELDPEEDEDLEIGGRWNSPFNPEICGVGDKTDDEFTQYSLEGKEEDSSNSSKDRDDSDKKFERKKSDGYIPAVLDFRKAKENSKQN